MKKFDIPVNFTVLSNSEQQAENQLIDFLRNSHREFAANHNITDSELVEFVNAEDCSIRCRDNDFEQRQSLYTGQQAGDDSAKSWSRFPFSFW